MRRPIAELFDLIAGTSTGGMLALGLTKPDESHRPQFTAADMCDLYLNEGPAIFPHSIWQEIRSLHGLADARYPAAPLEGILARHFGDTMLGQALKADQQRITREGGCGGVRRVSYTCRTDRQHLPQTLT